jgi:hypothetical protein
MSKRKKPVIQKPSISEVINFAERRAPEKGTPPSNPNSRFPPQGDVRVTINMRSDAHLKLKIAAAKARTTVSDLVEELVDRYIEG